MPQLDLVSFLPQLFWFVIIILTLYVHLAKNYLPSINKTLLVRAIINPLNSTTLQERTQSHLIFRKLIATTGLNIREFLSSGFKDLITLKKSRQVRQQQTEQTSWRGSWLSSFFVNSDKRACTRTIAAVNNYLNLRLKKVVLNIISVPLLFNPSLSNITIVIRFYLLRSLKSTLSTKQKQNKQKKTKTKTEQKKTKTKTETEQTKTKPKKRKVTYTVAKDEL